MKVLRLRRLARLEQRQESKYEGRGQRSGGRRWSDRPEGRPDQQCSVAMSYLAVGLRGLNWAE